MKGYENTNYTSAVAGWLMRIEGTNGELSKKNNKLSRPAVLEYIEVHGEEIAASREAANHAWRIAPVSMLGAAYVVFARLDKAKADEFFAKLGSGEELAGDSAIYKLREKYIQDRASMRKMHRDHRYAYVVKAWNFFILGEPVKVLRWAVGDNWPIPLDPNAKRRTRAVRVEE